MLAGAIDMVKGDSMKIIVHDYEDLRETLVVPMQGYAGTLPAEPEDSIIEKLHQAVKDVTGKAVEVAERPRMGFLP